MNSLYAIPNYTIIEFSGIDTEKFLQGQITQNIEVITENTSSLSCLCNPKGRVIAIFDIIKMNHNFLIILPTSMASIFIQHLTPYMQFFKTSSRVNKEIFPCYSKEWDSLSISQNTSHASIYEYLVTQAAPLNNNHDDWLEDRVQQKKALIYPTTSEQFTPHALQLHTHEAISFTKGCYTGQEVIARMHYLGKNKHRLAISRTQTEEIIGDTQQDSDKILLIQAKNHSLYVTKNSQKD